MRILITLLLMLALTGCSFSPVLEAGVAAGVDRAEKLNDSVLATAENLICGLKLPGAAYVRRYGGARWVALANFCQWNTQIPLNVPANMLKP